MIPPSPQAHLETFWRGQKRHLALALCDGFLHFWEPDSPEFQSAPSEWVFAVEHQFYFADERQITPQLLAGELEWALINKRVGRRFQLTDVHGVFLHVEDELYGGQLSHLQFHNGEVQGWCSFSYPFSQLFDCGASHIKRRLENDIIRDSGRSANFEGALVDANIPLWSNFPTNLCASNGNEIDMMRIANLIFRAEAERTREVFLLEEPVTINVVLVLGQPIRYIYGLQNENDELLTIPQLLPPLWKHWLTHFAPYLDTNTFRTEIEEGYRFFNFLLSSRSDFISFDEEEYWSNPPELSQHEQLEIRLQLRDWLRDAVGLSDERIAELLA